MSQREIAAQLNVSQMSVSRAMRRAEKRALAAMDETVAESKMLVLEQYKRVRCLAMRAYEASVSTRERKRTKKRSSKEGGDVTEAEIVSEARPAGDPRWLAQAQACSQAISKLLGLDAPVRVQQVEPDRPFMGLTNDEIRREFAETIRAAGILGGVGEDETIN